MNDIWQVTGVMQRQGDGCPARSVAGFQPFEPQGVLITDAQIDTLRDAEGV